MRTIGGHRIKPETQERIAREHRAELKKTLVSTQQRLVEKVAESHDLEVQSFWQEMLDENVKRNGVLTRDTTR